MVFVPDTMELVFEALIVKSRKKKFCVSYSYQAQAPWCTLRKYHRKIGHQIVCLQ